MKKINGDSKTTTIDMNFIFILFTSMPSIAKEKIWLAINEIPITARAINKIFCTESKANISLGLDKYFSARTLNVASQLEYRNKSIRKKSVNKLS